ncbi:hypothetical protein N7478_011005 [Penicillium angulare]|uniref:uncharacterized protein n=1 Tax=Penicillium angulare TaxID=116970 RepID=UPI002542686D|nr:uncharacterized protein N7478_011005 [Penicillium angulare]KAJ5263400.1 hypothetical protein N7478_011005 [Penicillium angulare]
MPDIRTVPILLLLYPIHYGLIDRTVNAKPSFRQKVTWDGLVTKHETSSPMIDTVRIHRLEQTFCTNQLQIRDKIRNDDSEEQDPGLYHTWPIIDTRFLRHSYQAAQETIEDHNNCGLFSDYMEFKRHASRLDSLFPESGSEKNPILHEARDDLQLLRKTLSNRIIQMSSRPSLETAQNRTSVFSSRYFQLSGRSLRGKEALQNLAAFNSTTRLDLREYMHDISDVSDHDSRTEVISKFDETQDDKYSDSYIESERRDSTFVLSEATAPNIQVENRPVELLRLQFADTITTASQYVSEIVFSAEDHSVLNTGTWLVSEIDEVQTVYSDAFTLRGSLRDVYIDELVHEIIKDISGEQLSSSYARRIADAMPDYLKAFSLRLGSVKSSQQEHRDVTASIRKYRQ